MKRNDPNLVRFRRAGAVTTRKAEERRAENACRLGHGAGGPIFRVRHSLIGSRHPVTRPGTPSRRWRVHFRVRRSLIGFRHPVTAPEFLSRPRSLCHSSRMSVTAPECLSRLQNLCHGSGNPVTRPGSPSRRWEAAFSRCLRLRFGRLTHATTTRH